MCAKISSFLKQTATAFRRQTEPGYELDRLQRCEREAPAPGYCDPEIAELRHDIEALDQFLRVQNLRRAEEARFVRLQQRMKYLGGVAMIAGVSFLGLSLDAHASSFEGSLQSLVGSVVGRILPILSLGFVGKNIFSHIQNEPEAGRESIRVAVGVVMLLGVNGVWSWLQGNVH